MKTIQTLLSAAVLLTVSSLAMATSRIDQRQAHQQQRIANGVASGQLTPRETIRLERREARIHSTEVAAKADGTVTPAERRHLRHQENRASRAIHRQKHDAQTVPMAN
ncbi:hypothetical protein [Sphaerotilus sp.]|uniref:hypothetical protein n=1 Tax=Sphaerotilus sp. TaxID=2093942 RepID=UPI00286E3E04|nr:hypothetical protein [Sphaerotilus sp.]